MIKAKQIEGKGLGVVATAIIPAGLEIECCPITRITREERRDLKSGHIGEYPFVDREAWTELPDHQKHLCPGFFAWGLMSLANHSFTPNAHVYTEETPDGPVAVLRAKRTILEGEEIEIGYPDVGEYEGDWTVAPGECNKNAHARTNMPTGVAKGIL